jgi:hypothetical protein
MCPFCFATAALIAGSAISGGGLTALVIRRLCAKSLAHEAQLQSATEEDRNGQHYDRS